MTDATANPPRAPGGRVKFRVRKIRDDGYREDRRASWTVTARRWLIFDVALGYVNATGRSDAMAKARAKWPDERRLRVYIEMGG